MNKYNLDFISTEEQLLIWLINYMGVVFGPRIVLRGGMVLRLLDSPRETHDLDYAFVGFKSKKDIVEPLLDSLKNYKQISVDYKLHSTNARFDIELVNDNGIFHVVLEASVMEECPSQSISTGEIARKYHLEPKTVLTMKPEVALANKLAAWCERCLVRDLYDAYYFYRFIKAKPDVEILSKRLAKLNYADKSLRTKGPKKLSISEFCDLLETKVEALRQDELEAGLVSLAPELLPGLLLKVRSAILELADWLRSK